MGNKPLKPELIGLLGLAILSYFWPSVLYKLEYSSYIPAAELAHYTAKDFWIIWYASLNALPAALDNQTYFEMFLYLVYVSGCLALPFGGILGVMYYIQAEKQKMMSAQTSAIYAKNKDLKEYSGKDGLILTKQLRTKQHTCFGHMLVVGPTGSGKTVSFFLPNILSLTSESSAVITDPKGELYQTTGNFHLSQGRRVELIKLDMMQASACWNPLDFPKDTVSMAKVCSSIVKNKGGGDGGGGDQDFWDATAIDLLMALVYIVKTLPGKYGNFRNAYMLLSECSFEAMIGLARHAVAQTGYKDILSRAASFSSDVAPEDTRNSTRFVLKTALAPFMMSDVAHLTATTTIDFCDLKREPVALYVSMPEHKVEGVKVVLSTLYMQIFDALLDMGQGGRAVFFLLDEFANVGKIIGFPQYIATVRSRNLSVSVCLQSMEQLTRNYSEAEKQEIVNNLKTTLILPGLKEEKTLQYIQNIAGKVSEYAKSGRDEEKRTFAKDRLPISAMRELEDNYDTGKHEAIVVLPNKPPFKDFQRRSYSDPTFKKILDATEKLDFQEHDAEFFEKIRLETFLDPGDITFLENVGTYIYYDGKIDKFPDDKKLQCLQKFEAISKLCGLPTITPDSATDLAFSWPKGDDEISPAGKVAQQMIVDTFNWLYREKLISVEAPKR